MKRLLFIRIVALILLLFVLNLMSQGVRSAVQARQGIETCVIENNCRLF